MAVVQFGAEDEATISKPVRRMRWATQRHAGAGGSRKRLSIMDRLHRHTGSKEEKRKSTASSLPHGDGSTVDEGSVDNSNLRKVFCNVPLPEDVKDEDGRLIANYARNKIRTAKYTPLSFVPKNLWFQFHNIANIYFLFTIILSVSFAYYPNILLELYKTGRCTLLIYREKNYVDFPYFRRHQPWVELSTPDLYFNSYGHQRCD